MKRWRLGRKRTLLSKSMSNVNHDMDNNLDLSTTTLRNAASISDMASVGNWGESYDGDDVVCQQQDENSASTEWIANGEENITSQDAVNEMIPLQNGDLKRDVRSISESDDRATSRYAPVYTRNEYGSGLVKQSEHLNDQWVRHYNPHNPRPASPNIEQEVTKTKIPEKVSVETDLNGNFPPTSELRRRVSVDVLRSKFALSNSKENLRISQEALPRIPSITIEPLHEEVEHDGGTEHGDTTAAPRLAYQDTLEARSAPLPSSNSTQHEAKTEASSSLDDEDLAGVKVTKDSSVDDDISRVQTPDSSALVVKAGHKSTQLKDKATKRMLRLFTRLPLSEKAINYYSCALFSDILLHGTLYISTNYIAFYSKIFYHVSKVLLPSSHIKRVVKVNTAKIIPNGIGIYLHDGRRFLFGSLLSRDATYNLLIKVATESGGMFICENEGQLQNGDDEVASTSEHSQTDQDGHSAHSSSSASSTPSTEHSPLLASLPRQSSSTSLERVDEVDAPAINTKQQQSGGSYHSGERKSEKMSSHEAEENDSSSDDDQTAPTSSRASTISKNSNHRIHDRSNLKKERSSLGSEPTQGKNSYIKEFFKKAFYMLWTPRSTVLNVIFCGVILLLVASSVMLVYRVQRLSDELSAVPIRSNFEQNAALELQQRIHSTAALELQIALEDQIHRLSGVRRSLNDIVKLFHPADHGDMHSVRPTVTADAAA